MFTNTYVKCEVFSSNLIAVAEGESDKPLLNLKFQTRRQIWGCSVEKSCTRYIPLIPCISTTFGIWATWAAWGVLMKHVLWCKVTIYRGPLTSKILEYYQYLIWHFIFIFFAKIIYVLFDPAMRAGSVRMGTINSCAIWSETY